MLGRTQLAADSLRDIYVDRHAMNPLQVRITSIADDDVVDRDVSMQDTEAVCLQTSAGRRDDVARKVSIGPLVGRERLCSVIFARQSTSRKRPSSKMLAACCGHVEIGVASEVVTFGNLQVVSNVPDRRKTDLGPKTDESLDLPLLCTDIVLFLRRPRSRAP